MGDVFLAEDERLDRQVALKSIRGTVVDHSEARSRFQREARAAAALNHPRIAAIYDIIEAADGSGQSYIVMEYVRGETLAAALQREAMPVGRTLAIGAELADALQAAHAHGIVHRDLKPSNIHLTPDGHVKVLDFGLAKAIGSDQPNATTEAMITKVGDRVGTPLYMAPEQLLGNRVDHRADIYALGLVLFEMVTGRRPFEGDAPGDLAVAALTSPAPTARSIEPSVPASLNALIQRMLAKAPGSGRRTPGKWPKR